MASIAGRAIIVTKTNKSGGALAKGDVVIVDTTNDNAVTTTTSAGSTVTVGVVVEENGIANNATGRVQFGGHCALVTPNASVTRGHYALTHTVAKQCTDGGASRVVGAFGVFTTGGTTPEIDLFTQPDGSSATGNMATDALWDAAGDLAVGTGANTGAKLTKGAAGTVPTAGASTLAYAYPPGYEFDYAQKTSDTNITATTEGTADTILTGNAVTYDGSTVILVEFYGNVQYPDVTNASLNIWLYDGASSIGSIGGGINPGTLSATVHGFKHAFVARARITPSNAAHTYSIRGSVSSGTGIVRAGAGGSTALYPAYLRQTKV